MKGRNQIGIDRSVTCTVTWRRRKFRLRASLRRREDCAQEVQAVDYLVRIESSCREIIVFVKEKEYQNLSAGINMPDNMRQEASKRDREKNETEWAQLRYVVLPSRAQ